MQAVIKSIYRQGEVHIQFSENLFVPWNMSAIQWNSMLSIKVTSRNKNLENSVKLRAWNATDFLFNDTLRLNLDFFDPESISMPVIFSD